MTSSKLIHIKITGGNINPSILRAKELGELIIAIEEMVSSVVSDTNQDVKKEDVTLALTNLQHGSIELDFTPNLEDQVLFAMEQIATAINQSRIFELPHSAVNSLKVLSRFSKRHHCETSFFTANGHSKFLAKINSETDIPVGSPLKGETTIYGVITRVGGATPKIQIRTLEGQLLHCEASENVAKEAARHLYSEASFEGEATWDESSLEILDFQIAKITNFRELSLSTAFEEMRELIGLELDLIEDIDEFMEELR